MNPKVTPDAAQFRCTGCGACCSQVWVNVTHADVRRVCAATGLSALEVVQFAARKGVDEDEDEDDYVDEGWVPFGEDPDDTGLMVLKIDRTTGACRFLVDDRCSIYLHRPRVCRLYPWELGFNDAGEPEIQLEVATEPCPWERDGTLDVDDLMDQLEADNDDREDYEALIAEWASLKPPDDPLAFIRFLGLPSGHSQAGQTPIQRKRSARKSRLRKFLRILD